MECDRIKPIHPEGDKKPMCSEKFFKRFRSKDRCDHCPRLAFNFSTPTPPMDPVESYFVSEAVASRGKVGRGIAFRRAVLRNNQ